jgi:hypothetical protein
MKRFILFVLAAGAVSCATKDAGSEAVKMDPNLRQEAEVLTDKRIFFGHQSVGGNILSGVKALAKDGAIPELSIQEYPSGAADSAPAVVHALVGTNTEPSTKCRDFTKALTAEGSPRYDLVALKFCYIDFNKDTDVPALFQEYAKTIAEAKAAHPESRFVHITVPLTASEGLLKSWIKRILKGVHPDVANVKRNEFNALLRDAYRTEPIFDLAKVESTRPDGTAEVFKYKGKEFNRMVPAYTNDGGHLNAAGKAIAAQEFIKALAAAVKSGA